MNYLTPVAPCDGTLIGINLTNNMANLVFYQTRKQTGSHLDKVDVISAIVMNVHDLEQFRNAITENLDNVKNHEK